MPRSLLLCVLLLGGCVVKVAPAPASVAVGSLPPEPLPPPVDFASVQERLDLLSLEPVDVDQRDRLDAARQLLRRFRDADPRAQRAVVAYLRALLSIEERSRPVEAPALYAEGEASFVMGGTITEEVLEDAEGPDPEAPVEAARAPSAGPDPGPVSTLSLDADRLRAEAEALVDAGDLEQALSVLERCRDQACWAAVESAWAPVRDAHVRAEREQAGAAFLAAREQADPVVRLGALREIRERLAGLADRYPEAEDAADVRRNLALVQHTLESTHTVVQEREQTPEDPDGSQAEAP